MKESQRRGQPAEEVFREEVVIDATVEKPVLQQKIVRLCWNTGEEKNCPGCYLRRGCKAKE